MIQNVHMKKVLNIVALIAAFAVLATASTYVTYRLMITRMTVEVPDLTGMALNEADRALESRGLYLEVSGEDHDLQIPVGHVLSQDISAGEKVRGMAEIKVVVSKGPAVKLIPGVVGEKLGEALKLFTQKGLDVRVVKVHSNTIEEDTVIAQWPAPEDWEGQNITVVASDGRYEVSYYCPSFLGLIKEDALMLARELGLNVELTETNDAEVMVESQKPLPGEKIASGGTLYLELKGVEYD
jgi:beta-lactam-binding protein with PASTA domain